MATTTRSLIVTGKGADSHPCPCGCASCEGTCCRLDCLEQPRFFCGQLLTDQDLSALVNWTRDKFGLSRYKQGWGVVCGLDVRCASDAKHPLRVAVMPGYAVGCCGEDIIVCEDATLDLSEACREEADPCAELRRQLKGAPAAGGGRTAAAAGVPTSAGAAGTGSINGQVLDVNGAGIPNATVIVINAATMAEVKQVTTDANGNFSASQVPAGMYRVHAHQPGLGVMVTENVGVTPNATTTITVPSESEGGDTAVEDHFRVVDIYLRYAERPAGMTTALGRSSCQEASECEHNRTRETYTLSYELGVLEGDPVESAARRWHEGYEKCLDVLVKFRQQFSFQTPPDGEDVRRWFIRWMERHPLRQFCHLRDEICRASAEQLRDERKVTEWLFAFVQDCRNAYLNCDCAGCERDAGVPLARVWLRSTDERWGKENCRIAQIDPYPPFRRPLSPDCWPAPLGSVNVGRAIWHRRQEACTMLADLGVRISEARQFNVPETLQGLEDELTCNLFVECGEERVALYYKFGPLGERIVGFCAGAAVTDEPTEERAVNLTVVCQKYNPATANMVPATEAFPHDTVNYSFTIENTSGVELTSVALKDTATGYNDVTIGNLAAGEARTLTSTFRQANALPRTGNEIHNEVTFTGVAPDGQTVTVVALHTLIIIDQRLPSGGIPIDEVRPLAPGGQPAREPATGNEVSRGDDFTAIRGIGESRAAVLHEAGINTYAQLAVTPIEQLKQLFATLNEGVLIQWIENAKSLSR